MLLQIFHKTLCLSLVVLEIAVKPVAGSLSYENKDFVKILQDPTRFHLASAFRGRNNMFASRHINATTARDNNNILIYKTSRPLPVGADRNYSLEKNKIGNYNKSVTKVSQYKKWQVGRVSRKQYEIINMLWRKTKFFVNLEQTTVSYHPRRDNDTKKAVPRQLFLRYPSLPNLPLTTPSYIEFYYLDESDERSKETTSPRYTLSNNLKGNQLKRYGNLKFIIADSPMFAFRIDDPNYKRVPTRFMHPTNRLRRRKTRTIDSSLIDFDSIHSLTSPYKFLHKHTQQKKIISTTMVTKLLKVNNTLDETNNISTTSKHAALSNITTTSGHTVHQNISTSEYSVDNETCPLSTEALTTFNETVETEIFTSASINVTDDKETTTAYDKIKFFEIYDKHTPVPYYDEKGILLDNVDIYIKGNELTNERKTLLEHVDQSIGNEHSNPHKVKHAKKHIIEKNKSEPSSQNNDILVIKKVIIKHVPRNFTANKLLNITKQPLKKLLHEAKTTKLFQYRKSKEAIWSQYPFAAAYVYEPSQVHCDAAGISPHWLVTSGSCLSRHLKNPGGEGRSAFVAYCGESWWNPERVAYVMYSLVHPRFQPRDKTRRHLYNIGLIQVVTSMASACSGWAPISLMSHQFVTDAEGSVANAIGWGLDRFDVRYSSNDLPKSPLMTYESQVFSDSCPGNVGYNKAKRLDEEGGIKNVYCLSLPPYTGEEEDPVHGGLLLVGGKLVALYLQEERRPWGDQCAQYTGTWRLVPWVLDKARENEEGDGFTLEI